MSLNQFLDRLAVDNEETQDEDYAFHIKTHPALKEFPPHYRNGFKLLVSSSVQDEQKLLCARLCSNYVEMFILMPDSSPCITN